MSVEHESRNGVTMAQVVTPDLANFHGHLHGGNLLNFLDKVAYACASRYAGCDTVTLSVDQVFFKEPIYVGELITCYATVNYAGKTSMEIGIKVVTENLQKRIKRETNTCYFTMVAVDKNGKPMSVPPYTPQNDDEKRRYEKAVERRKIRLQNFS